MQKKVEKIPNRRTILYKISNDKSNTVLYMRLNCIMKRRIERKIK